MAAARATEDSMDPKALPGSVKLAILIQALGPQVGKEILSSLGEKERESILAQMRQLGSVSPDLEERIAQEFISLVQQRPMARMRITSPGAPAQAKEKALGREEETQERPAPFARLKSLDPEQMAELMAREHPQVIAVILVHMENDMASRVLTMLPQEIRSDVSLRIANLGKVSQDMLEEVDAVLQGLLSSQKTKKTTRLGGVNRLAEILNQADQLSTEQILHDIEEVMPDLADQIKQGMFVFEDLRLVDNQGVQKILRSVETADLAMALKGASEEVREKVFKNMSTRAAEMLAEEIEVLGAVRMKQVEDAQAAITKIMRELESKGEIIVSGRRGEELIM